MNAVDGESQETALVHGVTRAWFATLGPHADRARGFVANGGDSIKAVAFTQMVHEDAGISLDVFDVLTAPSLDDLLAGRGGVSR